jgi:hypothetical protein
MLHGDAAAILQAANSVVGFVEAQGKSSEWMVADSRDAGGAVQWNYLYSLAPLLNLVNAASVIIVNLASDKSGKGREHRGLDPDSLSPLPMSSAAAPAAQCHLCR